MNRNSQRLSVVIFAFLALKPCIAHELEGRWRLVDEYDGERKVTQFPTTICTISERAIRFEMTVNERVLVRDSEFEIVSENNRFHLNMKNGARVVCQQEDGKLFMYTSPSKRLPTEYVSAIPLDGFKLRVFQMVKTQDSGEEYITQNPSDRALDTERSTESDTSKMGDLGDVEIKTAIMQAWQLRDKDAARELEIEYRMRRKILGQEQRLSRSEIEQVLALDPQRPDLHLQAIKHVKAGRSGQAKLTAEESEYLWQEIQYLRSTQTEPEVLDTVESLSEKLEPRQTAIDGTLMLAAKKTFESGLPMFISYSGKTPLIIDGSIGIASVELPVSYVRSSSLPPAGCRIVAKLVVQEDGQDMLMSHYTGYRPCTFDSGHMTGEFYTIGQPTLSERSVLFVFACTLFSDDENHPVPISNVLSIPVVGPEKDPTP
ncbi:MAG: hypothetical protein AAGG48_17840 [Planctomycetota bacterium]